MRAWGEHQDDLIARTRAAFAEGAWSVCMQAPTGFGKTTTSLRVIGGAVGKGNRVVFAARLTVLVDDTHKRLVGAGIRAGIVQASRPTDPGAPVQVASLDTLAIRTELPPADLLIVDECHCAPSDDVRGVIERYGRKTKLLGLTATPCRSDDKPLAPIFERLVQGPQVRELIECGALVPIDVLATRTGNVGGNELSAAPVDAYSHHTPWGRAIVFARDTKHATEIHDEARMRGIRTVLITAKSKRDERAAARTMLEEGPSMVVSVDVLREGWDAPACDTIILARSFQHVGSWRQAIGRGARSAPGKKRCTVLDLHESYLVCGLPDEDVEWSLGEVAITRKTKSTHVRTCLECGAVYDTASVCPRCGASSAKSRTMPRIVSSAEKMQRIQAIDDPVARDRALLESLRRQCLHFVPVTRAMHVARKRFVKKYGREPLCA